MHQLTDYMNNKAKLYISIFTLIPLITACASAPPKVQAPVNTPIAIAEQEVIDTLQSISEHSVQKHSFERISHCRYEIATGWRDLNKGYMLAKTAQRFSFTHDLRNIENTPAHSLKYKDGIQYWDEMLDLTFNRMMPTQFSYTKTSDYQLKERKSQSDAFSISGYESAPREKMEQLKSAFEQLAVLCGSDIEKFDAPEHKLLGRWEIFGIEHTEGALIITENEAGLISQGKTRVEGPWQLTRQDQYHLLTITPKDAGMPYNLMLDFINSNYARVLLLGDKTEAEHFAPLWSDNDSGKNPDEKKLFRKGDLR